MKANYIYAHTHNYFNSEEFFNNQKEAELRENYIYAHTH